MNCLFSRGKIFKLTKDTYYMESELSEKSNVSGVQETQKMGGSSDLAIPETGFTKIDFTAESEIDDNLEQPFTDLGNELEEQCETGQVNQNMKGSPDVVTSEHYADETKKEDDKAELEIETADKLEKDIDKDERKTGDTGGSEERIIRPVNLEGAFAVVAAGRDSYNNTITIEHNGNRILGVFNTKNKQNAGITQGEQLKADEKQSVVTDLTVNQLTDLLKEQMFMDTTIKKIEDRGIDGNTLKFIVQDEKALDEITCDAIDKSKLKALVDKKKKITEEDDGDRVQSDFKSKKKQNAGISQGEAQQEKADEKQSVVTDLTVSQLRDLLKNE